MRKLDGLSDAYHVFSSSDEGLKNQKGDFLKGNEGQYHTRKIHLAIHLVLSTDTPNSYYQKPTFSLRYKGSFLFVIINIVVYRRLDF